LNEEELDRLQYIYIEVALAMVMKLNDATFRPFIVRLSEWATQLSKKDTEGRILRVISLFNFLALLFGKLKSLVTSYATYVLDLAAEVLTKTEPGGDMGIKLLEATLTALEESFTHDDEQFWQSPHHFAPVATPLAALLEKSALTSEDDGLILKVKSAIISLATATSSQDQHKLINTALLKMLRHEDAKVRLVAVKTERELCEKMGDEWLGMLPEMLPFVSELLEDDDKDVERAGREWVRFLEGILGENLEL
jgi:U3 small nucleolar RNA-associated protein 10